jgi:hypothetical protein
MFWILSKLIQRAQESAGDARMSIAGTGTAMRPPGRAASPTPTCAEPATPPRSRVAL